MDFKFLSYIESSFFICKKKRRDKVFSSNTEKVVKKIRLNINLRFCTHFGFEYEDWSPPSKSQLPCCALFYMTRHGCPRVFWAGDMVVSEHWVMVKDSTLQWQRNRESDSDKVGEYSGHLGNSNLVLVALINTKLHFLQKSFLFGYYLIRIR